MSFYNLETRLEEGLFLYRNPGTLTNPNGSAMLANLILLFWVVANKNNLINLKSKFWDILVFASIGLAIISFVSKSGILAYFILCVLDFRKYFSIRNLFKAFVPIIIIAFLISNFIKQLSENELQVLEFGIDKIVNFDKALESEIIQRMEVEFLKLMLPLKILVYLLYLVLGQIGRLAIS